MRVLAQLRSLLGVGSLVVWLLVGELWERFWVWPAMRLRPGRADAILARYMKGMSRGIFAIIRAAGGRALRSGTVPTSAPAIIIMNHQSLLDIPTATLMAEPYVCRFIARARYGRFVPSVSLCMRLLGCPLIEPSNRKASLRALREAAREQPHGLLVFPEGHRTRDGEIQAFHAAGLDIMLRERPLPVYLLVTDGFWTCAKFKDFLLNIDRIDGRTEVLGPFMLPEGGDVGAFIERMRQEMVDRLRRMREDKGVAA
jgi:1-acyl-sn-glycerol-3-phosphate acyltransferase